MIYTYEKKIKIFERFFLKNYPRVKGFAFKLIQNEDDAEDVAQEIFIKIWNNLRFGVQINIRIAIYTP